jgi:hypothetical protein
MRRAGAEIIADLFYQPTDWWTEEIAARTYLAMVEAFAEKGPERVAMRASAKGKIPP